MRTYHLHAPAKWLIFAIPSILTLVFIGIGVWALVSKSNQGPPVFLAPLLLLVPALQWYQVLSTPHQITLALDGTVIFKSVVTSRQFNLAEVVSIQPRNNQCGFFQIDFGRGKQSFLGQFTGFHDFLNRLQSVNSKVVLLGC